MDVGGNFTDGSGGVGIAGHGPRRRCWQTVTRTASDACRDEVAGEARWAMTGNVCSHGHSRRHRAIYRRAVPAGGLLNKNDNRS